MEQKSILDQIIKTLQVEEFTLQKQLAFFTGQLQYNQKLQELYKSLQQQQINEPSEKDSPGSKGKSFKKK